MIGQGVERYGKNIFQSLQLIKKQYLINLITVSGSGGRRFKSSHPDQSIQWVTVYSVAHFLLWVTPWVTNEGQIVLNLPLPVIE